MELCIIRAQHWQRGFWKDRITHRLTHIGIGRWIITLEAVDN